MPVRDAIARLLARANAEGRTAIRCVFCKRQIGRRDCNCDRPWVDDYGYATCPARSSRTAGVFARTPGHQPPVGRTA